MARGILVLVEHADGKVASISLQLLALGRELAEKMNASLLAAVVGHRLDGVVEALRDSGAERIFTVDDPALAQAGPEVQSHAVCGIARKAEPQLILVGYSLVGMELAPAIATRLGVNALTNCVSVDIVDGVLTVTRPVFDSTLHAEIAVEGTEPTVIALQKGLAPAPQPSPKPATVEPVPVEFANLPARSRLVEITEEPSGDVDLTKAGIIVAVGRGIGDKEKIHFIEELADALGGVMACSRPVVDVGWLPRERQVGASGRSVAPKVYVACGISGAIQHLSGMRESKRIIAINKDPNAPIFQVAHFGVVGDLFEIVPALVEAAKSPAPAK